jgi:hypothetical protein
MSPTDLNEELRRIGPVPGHDPVERLRHTLAAYAESQNEERVLTATHNVYGRDVWTGITFGDLREILRRLPA